MLGSHQRRLSREGTEDTAKAVQFSSVSGHPPTTSSTRTTIACSSTECMCPRPLSSPGGLGRSRSSVRRTTLDKHPRPAGAAWRQDFMSKPAIAPSAEPRLRAMSSHPGGRGRGQGSQPATSAASLPLTATAGPGMSHTRRGGTIRCPSTCLLVSCSSPSPSRNLAQGPLPQRRDPGSAVRPARHPVPARLDRAPALLLRPSWSSPDRRPCAPPRPRRGPAPLRRATNRPLQRLPCARSRPGARFLSQGRARQ